MVGSKYIITLILLLGFSGTVRSQVQNIHVRGSFNAHFMVTEDPNTQYNIVGIPYLSKEWMYGKIRMKDDTEIETLLRYNVYTKALEVIYEKDTFELVKPFALKDFTINRRRFVYHMFTGEEFNKPYLAADYFEVLVEGKFELLMQHIMGIKTNMAIRNYMGGVGDGRDYFTPGTAIFYRDVKHHRVVLLTRKKREFLDIFGDKKKDIESYIKSDNLKISKEEDLIRIFAYYNRISS